MGISQNGGFIMENPINMDDLGVALFQETHLCEPLTADGCIAYRDVRNMSEYHRTRFIPRIGSRGFDTYSKWVH